MNLNLVKQMILRFYKKHICVVIIFLLYSCGSNEPEPISYEVLPSVDPNISLDCTGAWANSPLCKERNEALVELKKLDPLYQILKNIDNPDTKEFFKKVEILKKDGDKFYFEEFYFKSRDSYKEAYNLISDFNERNTNKIDDLLKRALLAFNTNNLNESSLLISSGLELDPTNKQLKDLKNRIINYAEVSELIARAKDYSLSKSYQLALDTINKALDIDSEREDAIETKDTLLKESKNFFFDQHLKNAYQSISKKEFNEALKYYAKAKSLFSSKTELILLKQEIDSSKRDYDIIYFSREGDKYYESENWEESFKNYKKVIDIDTNNQNINEKYKKTKLILDIYNNLNKYLSEPERLSSTNIRSNFKKVINNANNLDLENELKLIELINMANEAFNKYNEMIIINIKSNNETFVDILKTAQYEPFYEQNIKIYPGKYTFIAKKRGVQSFRKEITLNPGEDYISITAVCTSRCNVYENEGVSQELNQENLENIETAVQDNLASNQKSNLNPNTFIKEAKIINSTFNNNIRCTKETRNREMRLAFIANVDKSGKVISTRLSSTTISSNVINTQSLRPDERYVITVIEKALKKSRFKVPRLNGEPQSGKVNHIMKIPSDFCVS